MRHPANERQRPTPSCDVASLQRHDAENDSLDCPHCRGGGLATIYHPKYDGSRTIGIVLQDGSIATGAAIASAYCICPMGDWMRYNQEKTSPDVYRRMPELHDVLTRRIAWLAKDPRPSPDLAPCDMTDRPDWRKLVELFGGSIRVNPATMKAAPLPWADCPAPQVPQTVPDTDDVPF